MNLDLKIPKIFEPLFNGELADKRLIIYYGGRGGGKTDQLTIYFLMQIISQKYINVLVLREFSKTNANSLIANFRTWINELGLSDFFIEQKEPLFKIKATSIFCTATESKIIFAGINDNTAQSIKSISNVKYAWVEEANYLTETTYRILAPTIRAEKSQIIMSLNPYSPDEFVFSELIGKNLDDKFKYVCKVNFSDNPFFPPVLEIERKRYLKNSPRDLYLHIWEGEPLNYNEMQVIDIAKFGRFDDTQNLKGKYSKIVLSIDSAFSTKASADYSVISAFAKIGDDIHLMRIWRGHFEFNELVENLKNAYFWVSKNYGTPNKILIEKKASGQSLIQEIERLTSLQITPVIPTTDKFTRLTEVISHLDKIKLPLSDNALNFWVKDFLKECKEFRADLKHKHDDQIDTMIYALKELQILKIDFDKLSNLI